MEIAGLIGINLALRTTPNDQHRQICKSPRKYLSAYFGPIQTNNSNEIGQFPRFYGKQFSLKKKIKDQN